jgi:hypothetical protein
VDNIAGVARRVPQVFAAFFKSGVDTAQWYPMSIGFMRVKFSTMITKMTGYMFTSKRCGARGSALLDAQKNISATGPANSHEKIGAAALRAVGGPLGRLPGTQQEPSKNIAANIARNHGAKASGGPR